ncbi:MAG: sister chromatid cohesion protein PDS5 [Candidatus Ratteibacteria bacterium]|nr:sister chromatid cohesion protein PDS5 [Candidatus Ratteibacteria bacterium]
MDNFKSIKSNFNKLLLKATASIVIGAFLLNTVFIDLVWAKPNSFLRQSATRANDRLQREIVGVIINGLTKEELKEWIEKHGSVIEEETVKKDFRREFEIISSVLTEERESELFRLVDSLGIDREEMRNRIKQARNDLLENGKIIKQFPDLVQSSNKYGLGLGTEEYLSYVSGMLEKLKDEPDLRAEYLFHEALCYHFQELKGKEGHQIARQIQMVLFPQNYEGVVPLEGDSHPELTGKLTLALREFIEGKVHSARLDEDGESLVEQGTVINRKADAKDLSVFVMLEELFSDVGSLSISSERLLLFTEIINTKPEIVSINLVNCFLGMLKDNDADIRQGAVTALGGIGKNDSALALKMLNPLLEMLKDKGWDVRRKAVVALSEIGKTDSALALKMLNPLLVMLKNKDSYVRQEVVRALGGIGKTDSALASKMLNPLLEMLKDNDGDVRQGAVAVLGEIGKIDSTLALKMLNPLLAMLKDKGWDVRRKAVVALSGIGKTNSTLALKMLNPLLVMLKNKDSYVRQWAVTAVGEIGKIDSTLALKMLNPLLEMLKDKDRDIRKKAKKMVTALGEIGKIDSTLALKMLNPLLAMLKDKDSYIRQEAVTALGGIGKTNSTLALKMLNPLLVMLKNKDSYVRQEAVRALGGIGKIDSTLASKILNPLLEMLKDKNEYVRRKAVAVLGEIGKTDSALALKTLNLLLGMLKDKDRTVREKTVAALGEIGKIDSTLALKMLNPLLEMLKDNDADIRQGAVAALGGIGKTDSALASKILNPLLEMLKDNDGDVRQGAVAALGEIGKTDSALALKMLNPLLEMLKDYTWYVRQEAVRALGGIGKTDSALASKILNPLLEMLKDNDGDVREKAMAALGEIGKTDSALALKMLNPLLEMLKDNDADVREKAMAALGEIGKTDSALALKMLNPLLEMLKDNDRDIRKKAKKMVAALGEIDKTDSALALKMLNPLLEILNDNDANVRQEAARGLAGIMKTADLERPHLYEKLIEEELEREVPKRDKGFIIWSLAAVLALDKRNIADEREAGKVVCQEFYPLFKRAERVLEEINSSLVKSLQYDEELFWQKYAKQFAGLLSINPEAGLKFFEYNLRIKGEKVSGPQRMAYLFDDLKEVFYDSENTDSVFRILERISKKKLSISGFGDILRVTQGCLLLKRRDLLKDFAAQAGQTNPKEIVEAIGKGLLTDLVKILEIDIAVDGKAVGNWLKYKKPWEAVIAFTTFYKRFKEHNMDEELEIVRIVVEKVLEGKYKEYRYDTNQLAMLSQKQKDIWMENEGGPVEERDISVETIGKIGRIQKKIRDMVEHQHIQGFVREQLSLMLDNAGGNIEDLSRITTEARKNIKNKQPSLERIKEIKYFKDIKNIEEAESRLENLQIARSLLILFNLNSEEIETGKIGSKEGKKSLVKFINSLIDSLDKMGEGTAAADITDLRDNILQPTKLVVKGKITIEDTDDPFILAMIGEKPVATCQGYNYPNIEFFRCHPAYLADSNKKVVLVKRNGIPIARAIIRVMTKEEGQPVVFLEEIKSSTGETFKRNVLEHILDKAERMGIEAATKLDVGGIETFLSKGGPLTSTGTRNVSEYVDALGGSQSGTWQIAEVNILKPVEKVKKEKDTEISRIGKQTGGIAERDKEKYKAFKSSIIALKEKAKKKYKKRAKVLGKTLVKHKLGISKSLILFAEPLLANGGVIDLEEALGILLKNNVLGEVILYAEDPVYNEILGELVEETKKEMGSDLIITKKTKEELGLKKDASEVEEIEALIGAKKNVLCVIKGTVEDRDALSNLSNKQGIPIVVFRDADGKYIYSLADALELAIAAREMFIDLPPVEAGDMEKEYKQYKGYLHILSGA